MDLRDTSTFHILHVRFRAVSIISLYVFLLGFSNSQIDASPLVNVPLNKDISHFSAETYLFVHRVLNKRLLPGITRGSLPLSRGQVASLFLELFQKHESGEITLSQVDQHRLRALMQLYADEVAPIQKASDRGRHVLQLKGNNYYFVVDPALVQRTVLRNHQGFAMGGATYTTGLISHVYGRIRDDFAFSTNVGGYFSYGKVFEDLLIAEASHFNEQWGSRVLADTQLIDAYLGFRLPWFDLQFGQDNLRWGPGYHGALLVSENTLSTNMIQLQASYSHITFSAFTAILEDEDAAINEKYLSGHRAEGYFWNRLGIGVAETIVYGNRFEPAYLNPVTIYLVDELTISRGDSRSMLSTGGALGDNLIISADVRFRPIDDLEIYGELMMDDGDPVKSLHHWGTKFGVLGGIYVTDPFGFPNSDFHAEYAFINQYAYTHENAVNVYKHFSSVIGHHIGSDADNLWIEFRRRFTGKLESTLIYNMERHGEGNINKPPLDMSAKDRWTPLSGITQSEHQITLGVNYTAIGRYSFAGDITQVWKQNMGNQMGLNEDGHEVKLKAFYRF